VFEHLADLLSEPYGSGGNEERKTSLQSPWTEAGVANVLLKTSLQSPKQAHRGTLSLSAAFLTGPSTQLCNKVLQ